MPTYTKYRKGSYGVGATADTSSRPSDNLWAEAQLILNEQKGHVIEFWDDFTEQVAKWTVTNATAGTFLTIDAAGGIVAADAVSTTAHQGVQAQGAGAFMPVANSIIVCEFRCAISDTPITNTQFFAGLSEADTTIMASGANTSTNHLGYEMNDATQAGTVGTAGTANFYGEKAGARNTAAANVGLDVHLFTDGGVTDGQTSQATAGWVKLGFIVDGVTECRCYKNGVFTGDIIPTANVPIVALAPSIVCQCSATTDPVAQFDWFRVAQYGTAEIRVVDA